MGFHHKECCLVPDVAMGDGDGRKAAAGQPQGASGRTGSVQLWHRGEEHPLTPAGCPRTKLDNVVICRMPSSPLFLGLLSRCQWAQPGVRLLPDSLMAHAEPRGFSFQTSYCVTALVLWGDLSLLSSLTRYLRGRSDHYSHYTAWRCMQFL